MTVIHAEEFVGMGLEAVIERARAVVGDGPTYFSFDIDSLDRPFAPGTGTPEIGGLTTREAQSSLRGLKGIESLAAMSSRWPRNTTRPRTPHMPARSSCLRS